MATNETSGLGDSLYASLRVKGEMWVRLKYVSGLRSRAKRDGLNIVVSKPDNVERGQRSDTRIVALVSPADPTTIVSPDA